MSAHTHTHGDFRIRYGHPLPMGSSIIANGVNFSIFSLHATACTLVLFKKGEPEPFAEIPIPPEFRMGNVWAMAVLDLDPASIEYGYRFDGPYAPQEGHLFNREIIVTDPYAKELAGDGQWRCPRHKLLPFRGRIPTETFEWGHSRPLRRPVDEMVIYEMHVRGFTAHPTSGVAHPGTYLGLAEKIGYLRELGVNAIELMPIFEFNELENTRTNPLTGETLCNYWGYSTIGFFSPKAGYAASVKSGNHVSEFKELVRCLHEADIEILLDVVFNHTGEGNHRGPTYSFRGIDNKTYYMLDDAGRYKNYSGCGNTINCNHPAVRGFVISCLRYWASEFHIDGFRFDLASILGRDSRGAPLPNPPLLEALAYDPVLAHCDLIAEAWDAGGMYQVGNFPAYGRWMEWNGRYRDAARSFLRGDPNSVGEMVQRILGSPDLYAAAGRRPTASVNYICSHDGFTLRDLFSYSEKHNLENGENNRDGTDDNRSWNCGVEGETTDPAINALRLRMRKNAMLLLMVSQGVPMLLMGDECGRTQRGNNNAYCHDEEWNWFDWRLPETEREMLRFTRRAIAFRRENPALRQPEFLTGLDNIGSGYPDISWHGVEPWKPDWSGPSRSLAFMLCGKHGRAAGGPPHFIYCVFNMYHEALDFTPPVLPKGTTWKVVVDTSRPSPADFLDLHDAPTLELRTPIRVADHSAVVLVGAMN